MCTRVFGLSYYQPTQRVPVLLLTTNDIIAILYVHEWQPSFHRDVLVLSQLVAPYDPNNDDLMVITNHEQPLNIH